jgi:hypothetical protein
LAKSFEINGLTHARGLSIPMEVCGIVRFSRVALSFAHKDIHSFGGELKGSHGGR